MAFSRKSQIFQRPFCRMYTGNRTCETVHNRIRNEKKIYRDNRRFIRSHVDRKHRRSCASPRSGTTSPKTSRAAYYIRNDADDDFESSSSVQSLRNNLVRHRRRSHTSSASTPKRNGFCTRIIIIITKNNGNVS